MDNKDKSNIYFASDFHLGVPTYEKSLEREKDLVRWLDHIKSDALEIFLVGDIFDFWFEYKHAIPKGFVRLQGKIAELTDSGIKIHVFTGNHDMWIFDYIPKELGVTLYREPQIFNFGTKRFLIGHGDGSVHEVGTALIGTQTSLAVIPIGSGNGLARHMFIPRNIQKAIQTINRNHQITMDTVMVNDQPFLGVGGYGLDAVIAKKFDEDHKRGFWTYVKHVFKEFFRYNPKTPKPQNPIKLKNSDFNLFNGYNLSLK